MRLLPGDSRSERGAVMIIFAAVMVALLGITALVVDVANFHQLKRQAQATVDASALAGAFDLAKDVASRDADIVKNVKDYAADNMNIPSSAWTSCADSSMPAGFTGVAGESCISLSENEALLRVALPARTAKTFFASILGFDNWTINVAAEAEVEKAVFALDPDGPFVPGYDITQGDPGGGYGQCTNFLDIKDRWNLNPDDPDGDPIKATLAIFVFVDTDGNITVLCGSSARDGGGNVFWFRGIGGDIQYGPPNDPNPNPNDMLMHVSCSESWQNGVAGGYSYPPENGWANPGKGTPRYADPEGHYNEIKENEKALKNPTPKQPELKEKDADNQDKVDKYLKELAEYRAWVASGLPPTNWGPNVYSAEGNTGEGADPDWRGDQDQQYDTTGDPEWRVVRAIMVKTTVEDGVVKVPEDGGAIRNVCPTNDIERFLPGEKTTANIRLSN